MTKSKEVKPPVVEEITPVAPPAPKLKPITSFTQQEISQLDSVKALDAALKAISNDGLELQVVHNYNLVPKRHQ